MRAKYLLAVSAVLLADSNIAGAQTAGPSQASEPPQPGIRVTDPLVIARCSGCHHRDEKGNLTRISWIRTTPEGWQEAIKRMVRLNGLQLTPDDARSIVKSLSSSHGLAPEEAKPVMYMAEHRIIDETYPTPTIRATCASCHPLGRPDQWRRTKEEWQLLVDMHVGLFPDSEGAAFRRFGPPTGEPQPSEQAVDYLGKTHSLWTPEWSAWQAKMRPARMSGKWLVTAHLAGYGDYTGELEVTAGAANDEFASRLKLQPVSGGPVLERTGRAVVYAGYSWRGRSTGTPAGNAPSALPAEMREVLWIAPDGSEATGRWFWGSYDEFGFDVKLVRASGAPVLLSLDRPRLKIGSTVQRVRLVGDSLPLHVSPSDLDFGPGVTVRRVVSSSAAELVAEVTVGANAVPGKRDVSLGHAVLPNAIAVYDYIDGVKVLPGTALARLGGGGSPRPKGYQQFEAIAYHRGPDNKLGTADDVELGPVDVTWSVEEFYQSFDDDDKEFVGSLGSEGLFTPSIDGPNPRRKLMADNHGNVWIVATTKEERDKSGKPLVGRSYLVIAPPLYIIWDKDIEP